MEKIPTAIVRSIAPEPLSERAVAREFRSRLEHGLALHCAGEARFDPLRLLRLGHTPKAKLELFDTTFYLTRPRQNPDLRYFVAYVVQGKTAHARIFYKDVSLIWRVASHLVLTESELWIGKGDVTPANGAGDAIESLESTTDLPLEMQGALESLNQRKQVRLDLHALRLVLRRAPPDRIAAYEDFTKPRRRAMSNPANLVHRGRRIARFVRRGVPESLRFAPGFEPAPDGELLEVTAGRSSLYGGRLRRARFLSRNRKIQYLAFVAPRHTWLIPPQALTVELSSYGVRTVDVAADEDAFVPGYEYHFWDEDADPPGWYSQIPEGFAGPLHPADDTRADASAWLDRLPMLGDVRRVVMKAPVDAP